MSDETTDGTPNEPAGVPLDVRDHWGVVPWERYDWHGRVVALDESITDPTPPERTDVAVVLAEGEIGDNWDGEVAGIARLHDGTYIAWETFYGPTGHGFGEDAYGGEADILFASSWEQAWLFGLTEKGRRMVELLGSGS